MTPSHARSRAPGATGLPREVVQEIAGQPEDDSSDRSQPHASPAGRFPNDVYTLRQLPTRLKYHESTRTF